MSSERQIAANRANSLKSTGPLTPETKLISSQNRQTHGLLARTVVLDGEAIERFSLLLSAMQAEFQPSNTVESALVENMAVARWRQLRLWAMEQSSLSHEMRKQESAPDNSALAGLDNPTRAVLAFRALSDGSRSLDLMNRYETRYESQYIRALDRLIKLQEKDDFSKRSQFPVEEI